MITIETTAIIETDRKLIIQIPHNILPGLHRIVLVVEEEPIEQSIEQITKIKNRAYLDFPVIDVGPWPEGLSLRREDLYDDFSY